MRTLEGAFFKFLLVGASVLATTTVHGHDVAALALNAQMPAIELTPVLETFRSVSADTTLLPLLVRWAQTDGLVPVLNGRRVTTRSLRDEAYVDLPLTPAARSAKGSSVEDAIAAVLGTYASYRSDVEVTAAFKAPYFVEITTRKRSSPIVAQAPRLPLPTPLRSPADLASATVSASRSTPSTLQPPPSSPTRVATISAGVIPAPAWDIAARKSAGVMSGTWLVGDSPTLRAVVEAWATQGGFEVEWKSKRDYKVSDSIRAARYTGTFREALLHLAGAFGQLDSPLGMTFVNSNAGRPTLRVFDA